MEATEEKQFAPLKSLIVVSKTLKNSELKPVKLKKVATQLKELSEYLDCTENQVIIFTVIFTLFIEQMRNIDTSCISHYLSIDYIELLNYQKDLEFLIEKQIVLAKNNLRSADIPYKNARFSINKAVIKSIYNNQAIEISEQKEEKNAFVFVSKISNLIELRSEDEISTYQLQLETESLEEENEELKIVKTLKTYNLCVKDRIFFYEVCEGFFVAGHTIIETTADNIFDSISDKILFIHNIKNEENRLQELGLIKLVPTEFFSGANIKLTERGGELFLGEDAQLFIKKVNRQLIKPEKLMEKPLFYAQHLKKQVDFLTESLSDENHRKLQDKLVEKSLPKGISIIFYGAPGTGKTETVYQIAKQTGREIMQVDISETKSMWFGESEKKIKEVFDNYRTICLQRELQPILLFNEADAVFGKRKDASSSNVAQTENAIQNIILEEMEKLEGILIATTNLNQNLDTAFERRFLFKIKFENPDTEIKTRIWKSKMPSLSEVEAGILAEKFTLSGGEIENVVRKITMDEIIFGNKTTFEQIIEFCEREKFEKQQVRRRKIGF